MRQLTKHDTRVRQSPRRCQRCGGWLYRAEYSDGSEITCGLCGWRWYGYDLPILKLVEEEKPLELVRTCNKCGQEKPKSGFYKKIGGRDGLMAWCIDCWLAYKRAKARREREDSVE